ncbi:hypothetical protein [Mastigocoleus testarum]|uniref:Protein kinase domain-containing protein n=1 Tax=Mastigocoleus testarum BC008 TaxID=371196 RepID=A0A0V7ZLU1_9CYAN|nr:hypothetical protein [Mastigocoleus testarum]KST65419.1 hypothetical protein BC008_41520 [Mastigocoleus testarum BC008]
MLSQLGFNFPNEQYQILRKLGEGGFAQIYIVKDISLPNQPECVVKTLKTDSIEAQYLEDAKTLFHREAQILEQLGLTTRFRHS